MTIRDSSNRALAGKPESSTRIFSRTRGRFQKPSPPGALPPLRHISSLFDASVFFPIGSSIGTTTPAREPPTSLTTGLVGGQNQSAVLSTAARRSVDAFRRVRLRPGLRSRRHVLARTFPRPGDLSRNGFICGVDYFSANSYPSSRTPRANGRTGEIGVDESINRYGGPSLFFFYPQPSFFRSAGGARSAKEGN